MTPIKLYSVSLGCPKNRVDTERLLGSIDTSFEACDDIETAELVLINTCAFIGSAIQESIRTIVQAIHDLSSHKNKPLLVVAGCLVGRFSEQALNLDLPEVDLWLDNRSLDKWSNKLATALKIKSTAPGRLLSTPPSYAWLKIGDGCKHSCSFCTIPSIRGKLQSYSTDFLVEESQKILDQGVKEIILVAQDVSAWGTDLNRNLEHLLDKLLNLDKLERLRLMYLYPTGLNENLLKFLQDAGNKFMPYFDVPLQHSDPQILSLMGRPFAHNPEIIVDRIRKYFPDASLRTSLITGFPSESEEAYQNLLNFVEKTRFQNLGVFAYQAEEGTKAASMPNQIPDQVKDWRRDNLMEIQAQISSELLEQYLGQDLELIVDSESPEWPNLYIARTKFQAPEVDGITYISGENIKIGDLVQAQIVETKDYDLVALKN